MICFFHRMLLYARKNQAIVVSRDKGKVEHRAINPQGQFDLRHYQLDGALIKANKML